MSTSLLVWGRGDKTYDPNRRKQQTQLDARQLRIRRLDDHRPVVLHPDPDPHDAEIHHQQRPQPPVQEHAHQVPQRPLRPVVHALQVVVVDLSVTALQRGRASGYPSEISLLLGERFPRWNWTVGEPPEEEEADDDGDESVEEEHPLEADQAAVAVHLLEAGGDETDHGRGDLRRGEVLTDALAGAGRGVEEGEVVGHAGPHACDDDAEEEAEEAVCSRHLSIFT